MGEELPMPEYSIDNIIEAYSNTVFRICLIYTRNQIDAEDIFQNVFLKYIESHPTFNSEEHIKAWLIKVAKNECKNRIGSFWHRKVVLIDRIIMPVTDSRSRDVVRAVFKLPLKYREIIYLFYYEGYKIDEISKLLRIKQSTVKTRLSRGRTLLKAILLKENIQYE